MSIHESYEENKPRFWKTVYNRLGLKGLEYPAPEYAQTLPYLLGGLTLATFVILIVTGIYMAQFYNPNQLASNQSVNYIITQVPFGDFVRSIHFWATNIVFVLVLLHMARVFISGSYKRPREFTWLTGLALLGITMGFAFTGTMLNMGQEGVEALQHYGEIGVLLGQFGAWFTNGFSISVPPIGRIFVTHATLLTILFGIFIAAHIYLIKMHGIAPKIQKDAVVGQAQEKKSRFIDHLVRLAGWSFILLAGIAILALVFPESLSSAGVAGMEVTKPAWMFIWIVGFEDFFGINSLIWGPALVGIVLLIIPFIDRSKFISPRRRLWVLLIGLALLSFILVLALNGVGIISSPGGGM